MEKKPRKKRDKLLEETLKLKVGDSFAKDFGTFYQQGNCWLIFPDTDKRILAKYSSYYMDASKWFWGVTSEDWTLWRESDLIALILENSIGGKYSFICLNSKELKSIVEGRNTNKNGQRQINMKIYADGEIRFAENKMFDVESRMIRLP